MGDLTAITGPFVARAAARGLRPPVRLLEQDARAWELLRRDDALLLLDEFGDLWWGRELRGPHAIVDRPLWPEERDSLASHIAVALARVDG